MGQQEIIFFLQQQRKMGNDQYFSPKEIKKEFNVNMIAIRRQLLKLFEYGFLEVKAKNIWHRNYRLKYKYVNKKW